MAQMTQGDGCSVRARLLVRQRPGLAVAGVLVLGLLGGAAALGAVQAMGSDGVEIDRLDADAVRVGDASDGAAGLSGSAEFNAADGKGSLDGDGADSVSVPEQIVVDVSGAVNHPAVVTLDEGARVQDAIEKAGGLTGDADVAGVNRAARLSDGQQVRIPHVGEAAPVPSEPSAPTVNGGSGSAAPSLVNINTATVDELDALSGVGPSTAAAIVEDRKANGPFATIEDLMRVSGIGKKKFDKLKTSICV